jgi:hypothetical protein
MSDVGARAPLGWVGCGDIERHENIVCEVTPFLNVTTNPTACSLSQHRPPPLFESKQASMGRKRVDRTDADRRKDTLARKKKSNNKKRESQFAMLERAIQMHVYMQDEINKMTRLIESPSSSSDTLRASVASMNDALKTQVNDIASALPTHDEYTAEEMDIIQTIVNATNGALPAGSRVPPKLVPCKLQLLRTRAADVSPTYAAVAAAAAAAASAAAAAATGPFHPHLLTPYVMMGSPTKITEHLMLTPFSHTGASELLAQFRGRTKDSARKTAVV